jgi:hypothetical protein
MSLICITWKVYGERLICLFQYQELEVNRHDFRTCIRIVKLTEYYDKHFLLTVTQKKKRNF